MGVPDGMDRVGVMEGVYVSRGVREGVFVEVGEEVTVGEAVNVGESVGGGVAVVGSRVFIALQASMTRLPPNRKPMSTSRVFFPEPDLFIANPSRSGGRRTGWQFPRPALPQLYNLHIIPVIKAIKRRSIQTPWP